MKKNWWIFDKYKQLVNDSDKNDIKKLENKINPLENDNKKLIEEKNKKDEEDPMSNVALINDNDRYKEEINGNIKKNINDIKKKDENINQLEN